MREEIEIGHYPFDLMEIQKRFFDCQIEIHGVRKKLTKLRMEKWQTEDDRAKVGEVQHRHRAGIACEREEKRGRKRTRRIEEKGGEYVRRGGSTGQRDTTRQD
jgi:hypothetical protein